MPGPKDDAPLVPLAPAISRSAWGIVLLLHLAIVPLAVSTLPSGLSRADLAQFVVARMLGMAGFVLGAWLLVGLFDRIHAVRRPLWRVVARLLAIHAVAGLQMAVFVPRLLLIERAAGWSVPRGSDDFTTQFEVHVAVFVVYAVVYWA